MGDPDFRLLFEAAPGLYLVLDPTLVIVAVSDAYLAATMTRRVDILGRGLFDVFPDNPDDPHADGVSNLQASLDRARAHRRPDTMAVQKYDIRRPEGGFEERYWSPVNTPVLGADGAVRYIIHRVEDVTDFVRLKREGDAEIMRRVQQLQDVNEQLRALQAELESRVLLRTRELESVHEQLRQAQKMEAVGRLAGGIAHDFNNLLSVILNYCALALMDLEPDAARRADIEEIQRAGERATALTRQLLAFSRQQVLAPRVLDLNDVVAKASRMLTRLLGEDLELTLVVGRDLGHVKADEGQLEQVLLNLVVNARDAMPTGGKLTIETANVELDENYAREHAGITPGHFVMLAVSDTGVGMDRATQARIFDPFFTTKTAQKGTGLGLSTVLGIVQQSGGSIWVYSELGVGTTFKVYLPRSLEEVEDLPARPAPRRGGGNETILLVEDDAAVLNVILNILRRADYHVIVARDPLEAIEICERDPVRVHLLLTDVVMPRMNGRQLAERVGRLRPNLKVLFMSGYTDDAILNHGILEANVWFLQKPFTPESVTRKVREVLDSEPPEARLAGE